MELVLHGPELSKLFSLPMSPKRFMFVDFDARAKHLDGQVLLNTTHCPCALHLVHLLPPHTNSRAGTLTHTHTHTYTHTHTHTHTHSLSLSLSLSHLTAGWHLQSLCWAPVVGTENGLAQQMCIVIGELLAVLGGLMLAAAANYTHSRADHDVELLWTTPLEVRD